jgi:hypothetical protein
MMKCEDCKPIIEEFIEAELDEQLSQLTAAHLSSCSACSEIYLKLRREQEVYSQYLLSVEASSSLWSKLEAAIEEEKSARAAKTLPQIGDWFAAFLRLRLAGVALLLLLVAGLAIAIVLMSATTERPPEGASVYGSGADKTQPSANTTQTNAAARGRDIDIDSDKAGKAGDDSSVNKKRLKVGRRLIASSSRSAGIKRSTGIKPKPADSYGGPSADRLVYLAEQDYLAAIAILSQDIKRRPAGDSQELKQLRQALAVIDRGIAGTRLAVRKHPVDPVAAQYMMAAYNRKIDVLKKMISTLEAM